MTGIIFDIKRFAVHDGPGIRATVFLKGCPLRCAWCHNPEGLEKQIRKVNKVLKLNNRSFTKEETVGYEISAEKLYLEIEKERIFMDESGGGVTFSGGEPLMQHDFLLEILKICKQNQIHTTVDTSFFAQWDVIKNVAEFTDLFLIDLKLINSEAHKKHTGVSNELIIDNIQKISEQQSSVIIRIPLIPEITASTENISQSVKFLQTLSRKIKEVHLLPFHNIAKEKYSRFDMKNIFDQTSLIEKEEIINIEKQFINAGFTVITGG